MRYAISLSFVLILTACANDLSPEADRIRDARSADVRECERVGDVYGTSDGLHFSDAHATTNARNMALEMAAEMRATHVVWDNIEDGIPNYITGTAYRC